MNRQLKLFCGILVVLILFACNRGQSFNMLRPNSVVLAFGDSLTYGTGATAGMGYPEQLNKLIARKVINAGVSGETSAEGARRLPALLDKYEPDLLLLCHGGNDLLQKLDRQQLRDNLQQMLMAAKQRDIPVVMIAVPQPGLMLNDADLYKELAKKNKIPLVEGALAKLLADPQYRSGQVHLNAAGYRQLAKAVADKLNELNMI